MYEAENLAAERHLPECQQEQHSHVHLEYASFDVMQFQLYLIRKLPGGSGALPLWLARQICPEKGFIRDDAT